MVDHLTKENTSAGLFELIESLRSIELPKEVEVSEVDRYFSERERIRIEGKVRGARARRKKGVRTRRDKLHWATKRRLAREVYRERGAPRFLRKERQLVDNEGWYPIVTRGWREQGLDVQLTREEWDEHIQPILKEKGLVPFMKRYKTSDKVIRLDNIMIYSRTSKKPIFDGAEHHLRMMGYIL